MTRRHLLVAAGSVRLWADAGIAGTYTGKWNGSAASGDFQMKLDANGAGEWTADLFFTISGERVPVKIVSLRVDGAQVETKYDFELANNKLQSHLVATVKDGTLTGKYRTRVLANEAVIDEGTCEAKRD